MDPWPRRSIPLAGLRLCLVDPSHWQGLGYALSHLRLLGVLPRLGICYGLAAVIAISVKHKFIPWIIAFIFVGYYIVLELGNGYAHDATNILAVVDYAVMASGISPTLKACSPRCPPLVMYSLASAWVRSL